MEAVLRGNGYGGNPTAGGKDRPESRLTAARAARTAVSDWPAPRDLGLALGAGDHGRILRFARVNPQVRREVAERSQNGHGAKGGVNPLYLAVRELKAVRRT
jgi:hypothetical protein